MPTYEYTCPACGHEEEIWCKSSVRHDQRCAECGTATTQVIRHAPQPHWTSLAMGESASPEAIKRFDKMRRDQRDKEEKAVREHGSIK